MATIYHNELLEIAIEQLQQHASIVFATITSTWGSAPVGIGGSMLINPKSIFWGSVSGGCVENEVIVKAMELFQGAENQIISFGVATETAWSVGLSCGGKISIWIEKFDDITLLQKLVDAMKQRYSIYRWINFETKKSEFDIKQIDIDRLAGSIIETKKTQFIDIKNKKWFFQPLAPKYQLIIIGATHIAQELILLATRLDFYSIVIDPREHWTASERFPETEVMHAWPDEALASLTIDSYTAICILTHDPKIDDLAFKTLLVKDNIGYIGALGSKKTHQKRLERLAEDLTEIQLAKIHAPIGLNIGALGAEQIALSIMAEIIQFFNKI